jgi:hypothetical protein
VHQLSDRARQSKLWELAGRAGFSSVTALLESCALDRACRGICSAEGCDHPAQVEPRERDGLCTRCGRDSVASALVLAGIIQ